MKIWKKKYSCHKGSTFFRFDKLLHMIIFKKYYYFNLHLIFLYFIYFLIYFWKYLMRLYKIYGKISKIKYLMSYLNKISKINKILKLFKILINTNSKLFNVLLKWKFWNK